MGRLDVRIVGARGLPNEGTISTTDGFCTIKVAGNTANAENSPTMETEVVNNSLDPTWNQVFSLQVAEPETERLQIKVYHKGALSDTFIGQYSFALSSLTQGIVHDTNHILLNCRTSADIHVRYMAVDFGLPPTAEQIAQAQQEAIEKLRKDHAQQHQYFMQHQHSHHHGGHHGHQHHQHQHQQYQHHHQMMLMNPQMMYSSGSNTSSQPQMFTQQERANLANPYYSHPGAPAMAAIPGMFPQGTAPSLIPNMVGIGMALNAVACPTEGCPCDSRCQVLIPGQEVQTCCVSCTSKETACKVRTHTSNPTGQPSPTHQFPTFNKQQGAAIAQVGGTGGSNAPKPAPICKSCGICDAYQGNPSNTCCRGCSDTPCTYRKHVYRGDSSSSGGHHHHRHHGRHRGGHHRRTSSSESGSPTTTAVKCIRPECICDAYGAVEGNYCCKQCRDGTERCTWRKHKYTSK